MLIAANLTALLTERQALEEVGMAAASIGAHGIGRHDQAWRVGETLCTDCQGITFISSVTVSTKG